MLAIFQSIKFKTYAGSLLVAALLFLVFLWGLNSGQKLAVANIVLSSAKNLSAGLEYFYQDQERYPNELEFADAGKMLDYFSPFPPNNFVSSNCSSSFVYKRVALNSYQINFCLPIAFENYNKGWNTIKNSHN